jgi:NADH-ubiquinone oxidoreductase chain 1
LAETNLTPFDFAEGESELVSGFNIEYGAGGFALIFLAEYASILFMRLLFCVIFWDVIWILYFFTLGFLFFLIYLFGCGEQRLYMYNHLVQCHSCPIRQLNVIYTFYVY